MSVMLWRAEATWAEAWSNAFRPSFLAFSSFSCTSSPASFSSVVAASATCSMNALLILSFTPAAPTSVIFGAIALAFSLT